MEVRINPNLTKLEQTAAVVKREAGKAGEIESVILEEQRGEGGGSFRIKLRSGRRGVANAADSGNVSVGFFPDR